MSLKSKLDSLTVNQRRLLLHAFEMHISQFVNLPDDHFIGVNISTPSFRMIETVGVWSFGKINTVGVDE